MAVNEPNWFHNGIRVIVAEVNIDILYICIIYCEGKLRTLLSPVRIAHFAVRNRPFAACSVGMTGRSHLISNEAVSSPRRLLEGVLCDFIDFSHECHGNKLLPRHNHR